MNTHTNRINPVLSTAKHFSSARSYLNFRRVRNLISGPSLPVIIAAHGKADPVRWAGPPIGSARLAPSFLDRSHHLIVLPVGRCHHQRAGLQAPQEAWTHQFATHSDKSKLDLLQVSGLLITPSHAQPPLDGLSQPTAYIMA